MACDPNHVFSIDNHDMTVIETEGTNVEPVTVNAIQILAAGHLVFPAHTQATSQAHTQAHIQATIKLPSSYHQATVKLPSSYRQATIKLPSSYHQATVKLPSSYRQATIKLPLSDCQAIFSTHVANDCIRCLSTKSQSCVCDTFYSFRLYAIASFPESTEQHKMLAKFRQRLASFIDPQRKKPPNTSPDIQKAPSSVPGFTYNAPFPAYPWNPFQMPFANYMNPELMAHLGGAGPPQAFQNIPMVSAISVQPHSKSSVNALKPENATPDFLQTKNDNIGKSSNSEPCQEIDSARKRSHNVAFRDDNQFETPAKLARKQMPDVPLTGPCCDSQTVYLHFEDLKGGWDAWPQSNFAMDVTWDVFEDNNNLSVHWATNTVGSNGRQRQNSSINAENIENGAMTKRKRPHTGTHSAVITQIGKANGKCDCCAALEHVPCPNVAMIIKWAGGVGYFNGINDHNHPRLPHQLHPLRRGQKKFTELVQSNKNVGPSGLAAGNTVTGESVLAIDPVWENQDRVARDRKKILDGENPRLGDDFISQFIDFQSNHPGFIVSETMLGAVAVVSVQTPFMAEQVHEEGEVNGPFNGIVSDAAHGWWKMSSSVLIMSSVFCSFMLRWVPTLISYSNGSSASHYEYHFLALMESIARTMANKEITVVDEIFAQIVDFTNASSGLALPDGGSVFGFEEGIQSAILRYKGAPDEEPKTKQQKDLKLLTESMLHPLGSYGALGEPMPGGADMVLNLTLGFQLPTTFMINDVQFVSPSVPVLLQVLSRKTRAQELLLKGSVYGLPRYKTIEVRLFGNNAPSVPHPLDAKLSQPYLALDPSICYLPEYVYHASIIPGPKEPDINEMDHFICPVIKKFVMAWRPGLKVLQMADSKLESVVEAGIFLSINDLPAA
ncbi:hypothetical protein D9758_011380 [Tetrapyrgos nigripes]|uniref:Plastocyanin-like domain-containing protein n=1 Tax=Tetrapyrgos nigripes TaxID=182062 RepID=A0A8H5G8A3_9AGAR|nr:hypothetical protein D9758_011380 [Tetrapyrgos nigripes]